MTREAAEALLVRLPTRRVRVVEVDFDSAPHAALAAKQTTDAETMAAEARQTLERASAVIRAALASFPAEDRVIFRFRFARELSIAEISRMLRLPQRPLYRRIEALLARLRAALLAAGIDSGDVAEVLERAAAEEMDLGLMETGPARQSKEADSTVPLEST